MSMKGKVSTIKKFKDLFEHYEAYSNKDYLMNKVSARLLSQVSNVFVKGVRNKVQNYAGEGVLDLEKSLKELCNIVCAYTDLEETSSWGEYFIIEDYEEAFQRFALRPFPKFMDAVSEITLKFLDGKIIKDLNKALADNNFGYRIRDDVNLPWISINSKVQKDQEIHRAAETAAGAGKHTTAYIRRIKEHLAPTTGDQASQAVKDCLSAMEAFVLKVTKAKDLQGALEIMRADHRIWGPETITGDGMKLWTLFQQEQNDNDSAGNAANGGITFDQAVYYIDRVLAYVNYLARVHYPQEE